MKKSFFYFVLAALVVSTIAFVKVDKKTTEVNTTDSYVSILNGVKAYTLEIAEAMPADKYTFRPHDSIRSFGEQMAHLGMSSKFLLGMFIKGEPMPTDPKVFAEFGKLEKETGASKEACIKSITEAFDAIIATHESMNAESLSETFSVPFDPSPDKPKFSKEKGFQFISEHIAHHRGQALVSLRMQGIKAPRYRLY
ncbi:MAG: DinB family protein [Flavobacteriaceae bacterium]|nr:DinB family protein [Flavobacteriaceae bacterium]